LTAIELLIVIGIIAMLAAAVALPLATMQTSAGISSSVDAIVDGLRRAQLQAASGYAAGAVAAPGVTWGVHFSDTTACALPASTFQIYGGATFASSTNTVLVTLPGSAKITALNLGGGCDVGFNRFIGTTSASGTVTISKPSGQTKTVSISSYGRVSRQ
jgi:type II secretory pathway pseudopilin PulG